MTTPFHLAFPVHDLSTTRDFYEEVIGCKVGRTSDRWIDLNFFGHQVTAHLEPEETTQTSTNEVDGTAVPIRHFGAILEWNQWHEMADRLERESIDFVIKPHIRFEGKTGEQATMFLYDPSGNALEFKSFKDPDQIFEA